MRWRTARPTPSEVSNHTIILDHGFGTARVESNHLVGCDNDFVSSGSNSVLSDGRNVVHKIANSSGLTYITPTPITLK